MSTSKKLLGSYSVPNVNLVYVCLIGNITPNHGVRPTDPSCESVHSRLSRPSLHIVKNIVGQVGTSRDDDTAIEVQRSVAFHEFDKLGNLEYCPVKIEEVASEHIPLPPQKDNNEDDSSFNNPKVLSLTKTKWLSDSRDGSPDARESLLKSTSESSVIENFPENFSAQALSTVLALDKEHNLFGLSHTYIQVPGTKTKRKIPKDSNSKAVFHQTAIVQVCYKTCCKRRSNTDLPSSLKCGGCRTKCSCAKCMSYSCAVSCASLCRPSCSSCAVPCNTVCAVPCNPVCAVPCNPVCAVPCNTVCSVPCNTVCARPCPVPCRVRGPVFYNKPACPKPCRPVKPCATCSYCCAPIGRECPRNGAGFQISVIKKPKVEPTYMEIEPKSSCILSKPFLARSCNHRPSCIPPSSCFPYLMPCFWPVRSGAPCCDPPHCFHNTPCPRGRSPRSNLDPREICKHVCADEKEKCENLSCIGRRNEELAKALAAYNQLHAKKPKAPSEEPEE